MPYAGSRSLVSAPDSHAPVPSAPVVHRSSGPDVFPHLVRPGRKHFRNVSAVQPIFDAIDAKAAHCDSYSRSCSNTIRTARSRTGRFCGEASPRSGHPGFDPLFSLFPSYRAIIRGLMRRTPAVRSSNGFSFRFPGLLRSRQPLSLSGTRGLRVLTIPGRSYRIRQHVSACYPKNASWR